MFALTARTARLEAGLRLRGRAPKARVACAPGYVARWTLWEMKRPVRIRTGASLKGRE